MKEVRIVIVVQITCILVVLKHVKVLCFDSGNINIYICRNYVGISSQFIDFSY
jgi:hypothetical protein